MEVSSRQQPSARFIKVEMPCKLAITDQSASAVSKVAEKLIAQQVIAHLNSTSFALHPIQFGSREKHSTQTANCFFIENVKYLLEKGGVVGAAFLHLKTAFDTVNHEILWFSRSNSPTT